MKKYLFYFHLLRKKGSGLQIQDLNKTYSFIILNLET
jgi:hypothetical protein